IQGRFKIFFSSIRTQLFKKKKKIKYYKKGAETSSFLLITRNVSCGVNTSLYPLIILFLMFFHCVSENSTCVFIHTLINLSELRHKYDPAASPFQELLQAILDQWLTS